MDSYQRATAAQTQTSKVAWVRKEPYVQKTLKVSEFGLKSNHWLQNANMLDSF